MILDGSNHMLLDVCAWPKDARKLFRSGNAKERDGPV
jgi:hypothetical protein